MLKINNFRIIILIGFFIVLPFQAFGLTLKIGSLAPVGTPYDAVLREIGEEWNRISGGRITIKIFPGGIAGGEADMIRKVRIGQLQGVVLTTVGLNKIDSDLMTMALPLTIQSEEEFKYVAERMLPEWTRLLDEKGFALVAVDMAGWVNIFSKEQVYFPEDLQPQKFRVFHEEPEMEQVLKTMGFRVIPLTQPQVMSGLQTGMVEAFYAPPLLAAAQQWFALAPNMLNLKITPVVGGLIISNRTWARIPEEYHEEFKEAAKRILLSLNEDILEMEKQALTIMKEHGLVIHEPSRKVIEQWTILARESFSRLAGVTFSREIYEEFLSYLKEYRSMND
jgi:TRAP-type C4-dicarboxylate transport system substrate-binding protein